MLDIFQFEFMQRAFLAGSILAIVAPVVGTFIVVRRLSALADTLAHVSLIGVSIGLLTGINPVNMAIVTCILGGIGIEKLRAGKNIFAETVLVLFISASLGISSIIFSLTRSSSANFVSYLFGSINTVTPNNLLITILIGLLVVVTVYFLYPGLFLVSLDEDLAMAKGLKVGWINLALIILAALVVSIGIQVVGVLLIGALMVIPVVTAMQYKLSFRNTIWLSLSFSLVSVWCGLFISYYLNLASGGTIVILNLVFFTLSSLFSKLAVAGK